MSSSFYDKKKGEFIRFVNERFHKVYKDFTFSKNDTKISYVCGGEKRQTLFSNLDILKSYMNKFLETRSTDIESLHADKNDREAVGSRSYSHHMRPAMMEEFDRAYKNVSNTLKYDVFDNFETRMKLPKILNDGTINYSEKKEKDIVVVEEAKQIEPIRIRETNTLKDAWDL